MFSTSPPPKTMTTAWTGGLHKIWNANTPWCSNLWVYLLDSISTLDDSRLLQSRFFSMENHHKRYHKQIRCLGNSPLVAPKNQLPTTGYHKKVPPCPTCRPPQSPRIGWRGSSGCSAECIAPGQPCQVLQPPRFQAPEKKGVLA